MNERRNQWRSTIAACAVLLLALTGCEAIDASTPSPTPPATAIGSLPLAEAGHSIFGVGCDSLATTDDLTSLFGVDMDRPTEVEVSTDWVDLAAIALKQNGALVCGTGEANDFPSLSVVAVPEFGGDFERHRARLMALADGTYDEFDIFDGSVYECSPDYDGSSTIFICYWDVLANGVWVSVTFYGLLDSAVETKPHSDNANGNAVATTSSVVVQYLSKLVRTIVHAPRLVMPRSSTALPPCSRLITATAVHRRGQPHVQVYDELGVGYVQPLDSESESYYLDSGGSLPTVATSMRHAGSRYCTISPSADYDFWLTEVTVAPGGSWAFDKIKARKVEGIGDVVSQCWWLSDDGPFCSVEALVGDTLIGVQTSEVKPLVATAVLRNVVANLKKEARPRALE